MKDDVGESVSWFQTLGGDQQAAIFAFGRQLIEVRSVNEVEIPPGFADQIQTDEEKIKTAFNALSEENQTIVQKVMTEDTENLVDWLQTLLNLKNKAGDSLAKKFLDLLKKGAGKVAGAAKAAMKPIKELYKQIKPNIQQKLKSLVRDLPLIKEIVVVVTDETRKFLWEMLTSFFKKNLKAIKSTGESLFKKKLEEAANSNDLTDEQKQSLEKNKGKLIDSYDKVSFPTKKFMDSLPGLLGSSFAIVAEEIIKLIEFIMKLPAAAFDLAKSSKDFLAQRAIALAMFLMFSSPDKFKNFDEQSLDDLDIKSSELIAVAPTPKNKETAPEDSGEESNTEDDAEYDEQIQEYVRKLTDPEFTSQVMEDILANKGKAKEMGKETIEAVASIIEIAKIIKNSESDDEELNESIARVLSKIKSSAKSMMNNSKARSNFSEFKNEYVKYLGEDGVKKAKTYIMFLLKFMDGARTGELIKTLKTKKGDIRATRLHMKGLRDTDSRPNPSKEAQPLPPEMSREDFEDRTPGSPTRKESLEKALEPIIEAMLKEQYNY